MTGQLSAQQLQRLCMAFLLIFTGSTSACAQTIPATIDEPLVNLRPGHPRVLATDADFARIRNLVQTHELARAWYERTLRSVDDMLQAPPPQFQADGRQLMVARALIGRALTLGLLQHIQPDPRYFQRIESDIEAVIQFPHWNPGVFLDTGEMTFAVALAYDWFYDQWSDQQRTAIRDALISKGLEAGAQVYRQKIWWSLNGNNWNQVCNGGLITGAIAVADEDPRLATDIIQRAVASLPIAMARYNPDGGFVEGPIYWSYGTRYNVIALCSLVKALGTDFGLSKAPGFDQTSFYPVYINGPGGLAFNYADTDSATPAVQPAVYYIASLFDYKVPAQYLAARSKGGAFELLWLDTATLSPPIDETSLPLDKLFESCGVFTMRSAWKDDQALYIGGKGGHNGDSHSHLDLGSFVMEAQGVRWFTDQDSDHYSLPGYWEVEHGGRRWLYYRLRAEGHNTLVIGDHSQEDQVADAEAPVTLDAQPQQVNATIDLSKAYEHATSVQRQITLHRPSEGVACVEVRDQITTATPQPVWWFAHTQAAIEISSDGRSAVLKQQRKRLHVDLLQPADAQLMIMPVAPMPGSPDPEGMRPNLGAVDPANPNEAIDETRPRSKLAIALENTQQTTIVVRFTPVTD